MARKLSKTAKLHKASPALRDVLRKIVNLSGHPMFPDTNELPAFAAAILEAQGILAAIDAENVDEA